MTTFDRWADAHVTRWRGNPVADRVMYTASSLGDDGRFWIGASIARAATRPNPVPRAARQLIWLGIESVVVNGPVKHAVRRERPVLHLGEHPHRLRRPRDSSFPSGHAASAGHMAMLLSEDGWAPVWWTVALTIAASRVYVGVHHSSDVIAGLALGAAFGWLARQVGPRPSGEG